MESQISTNNNNDQKPENEIRKRLTTPDNFNDEKVLESQISTSNNLNDQNLENEIPKKLTTADNFNDEKVHDNDSEVVKKPLTTNGVGNSNSDFLKVIQKEDFIDSLHKCREEFLDVLKYKVNELFDNVKDLYDTDLDAIANDIYFRKTARKNNKELPIKEFVFQESVLTKLLKISHIRTVYHMFVAILLIFWLNTIITDWVEKGDIFQFYHLKWIIWAFGKIEYVICVWMLMQSAAIFAYLMFILWLDLRNEDRISNKIVDKVFLFLYIIFQCTFLTMPVFCISHYDLPPCSSAIVILENIRLMMKVHAFVRESVMKDVDYLNTATNFSRYLYFLFAPTLVYRDEYPRNPTISWSYVASNFAQVIFCIVYMYYIFMRFCVVHFNNFSSSHVKVEKLVISIFGCMLPGTLVLLICFFCFLHSWLNAFAEMLRFGDRLFYKEWWNSTTFSNYYRTWNVVVHDWLYSYIYRDVFSSTKNRKLAMITVFLVSAVVHEYVLVVMFRFFFPVLFILFGGAGFGMMFIKGKSRFWNIGFWFAMFIGTGILMCLYSMEWYARINCERCYHPVIDMLIPRSFFCCFENNRQ